MSFTKETLLNELKKFNTGSECTAFVYDVIDSTNLEAKRLIAGGRAGHGCIVLANEQTAGRGRLGRDFYSPADGLYMSIIVKPDFDLSRMGLVTVGAAAAVSESLDRACECRSQIKWVNDIYIPAADGENLKVCGILTEANTDKSGRIDYLVIGIGINTSDAAFPESLQGIAGHVSERGLDDNAKANLAALVIAKVLKNCDEIRTQDVPHFLDYYREKSLLLGQDIFVYKGSYRKDPSLELGGTPAIAMDIADDGGLIVEYPDGSCETLTTGEISVRKAL